MTALVSSSGPLAGILLSWACFAADVAVAQTHNLFDTAALRGTLAGQALDGEHWTVRVAPGAAVTGAVTVRAFNRHGPNAVVPMGYTWTWGARSSAIVTLDGWISTGWSQHTANINLTAPSQEGTYYILFGFRGEFTLGQVFSCTNWQVGAGTWNDGNDYHDMTHEDLALAHLHGCAFDWPILATGGFNRQFSHATLPIRVEVASAPAPAVEVGRIGDVSGGCSVHPDRLWTGATIDGPDLKFIVRDAEPGIAALFLAVSPQVGWSPAPPIQVFLDPNSLIVLHTSNLVAAGQASATVPWSAALGLPTLYTQWAAWCPAGQTFGAAPAMSFRVLML